MPLPGNTAIRLDSAWAAYRNGRLARADSAFREVLRQCPRERGALNGLGYVAMRRGEVDEARRLFGQALAEDPDGYDAITGSGMAAFRQGDVAVAGEFFRRAARLFPQDSLVRWYLARVPESFVDVLLPAVRRPAALRLDARVGRRIFEVPNGSGGWVPLWIKGVNIGAALPGKHPSEFPVDDRTYEKWLSLAAEMGSNTIRVYTIHPPHFYRAVERWNLAHPAAPLWVIHGVWTETPPGDFEERCFRFVVQSYDPQSPGAGGALLGCDAPLRWTWEPWEAPSWHEEVKPLFGAMRDAFHSITGSAATP